MSIGIGAFAKYLIEDSDSVTYEYGGYNLNKISYDNADKKADGRIIIQKKCFVKPEIHKKIKKINGRKRLIEKKTPVTVDYLNLIEQNLIFVENCSNCHKTYGNKQTDIFALQLINLILYNYQIIDGYPKSISYNK